MLAAASDIHFSADDAPRFLPWLIGIWVFFASLFLCVGVGINAWLNVRTYALDGHFTVSVPYSDERQNERVGRIQAELEKTPGVSKVTRLADAQLMAWLEPWLGKQGDNAGWPLPAVFEVATLNNALQRISFSHLQATLEAIVPGTEVDSESRWAEAFNRFCQAIQQVLWLFTTIIALGIALMIAFMARTALKLHAKTVLLLHSIGAEDAYIARQFQSEALRLALPASLLGSAAGGFAYLVLGRMAAILQSGVMPVLTLTFDHLAMLVTLPIVCALLAQAVARGAVLRKLRRSL